jgi:tight adherence protein B
MMTEILKNLFPGHHPGDMPLLPALLLFLTFLCLAEGIIWHLADPDRQHRQRMHKRLHFIKELDSYAAEGSLLKGNYQGILPILGRSWQRLSFLRDLQLLLIQADVPWSLGFFLLLTVIIAAVGLLLGFLHWGLPGALILAGLGLWLPVGVLQWRKKRRLRKFEAQLPDAMELLARGLRAGHAFSSGLQLVAKEMPNPMGLEFFKTFNEYNHGLDLNGALLNLCSRIGLKDLRFFTTAVMIQRETGGNLAEILEKIAALVRERFKLRNQIKALTAEGRLSGIILVMLPPATGLALYSFNPEYILLLVRHPMGRMMLAAGLVLQTLGMLAIRKIVNIKV